MTYTINRIRSFTARISGVFAHSTGHQPQDAPPCAAPPPLMLPRPPSMVPTTRYGNLVQFPRVGGQDGPPDLSSLFADPSARAALEGGPVVYVYISGCAGLWDLGQRLGMPIFKLGTTSNPDIRQRLTALSADRYGAVILGPDGAYCGLGFDQWAADHLPSHLAIALYSPVSLVGRALQVRLPTGMTPAMFEERLAAALLPVALHTYADSGEGREYLASKGVHASECFRYSEYGYGLATRLSVASELYIYRKNHDAWRLLRLIENVILDQLTAKP